MNPQQQLLNELTALVNESSRTRNVDSKTLQERLKRLASIAEQIDSTPKVVEKIVEVAPPESEELAKLVSTLRQSQNLEQLLQGAVDGIKTWFGLERVLVYQFQSGIVSHEALADGFTPAAGEKLPALAFGQPVAKLYETITTIADVTKADLTPYQQQLQDRFQVRSLFTLPLVVKEQLWGIVVGQKCLGVRTFSEKELKELDRVRQELEIQLQIGVVQSELKQQIDRENAYGELFFRLNQLIGESLQQQSLDFYRLFREVTQEIRQILSCDRCGIYKFSPDWSGEFIAESVKPGWVSVLQEQQVDEYLLENTTTNDRCILKQLQAEAKPDADTYLQRTQGGEYTKGKPFTKVDDIYAMNFDPCYIKRLEKYQARAYIIVPILENGKAWGLLAVYQNDNARAWQMAEVEFLQKVADQMGVALAQADNLEQLRLKSAQISRTAEREASFSQLNYRVSELIAEGLQQESVNTLALFKDVTQELRQILQVDRAAIYKFNPDWSGAFIAESVGSGWVSVLEDQQQDEYLLKNTTTNDRCILKTLQTEARTDVDTYLQKSQGGKYKDAKTYTKVNDVYQMNFDPCYIKRLEKYQAKAYIIVPVYRGNQAWGLLAIYQNSGPREWEEGELNLLQQVAVQLGIVLLQQEYLAQIQERTAELSKLAELERSLNRIVDKIRQTQDIDTIFRVTTQEVRLALQTDRAVVYKFNPDFTGQVIAEAVGAGWVSLLIEQSTDEVLRGDRTQNDRCTLRKWAGADIIERDTYLQDTKGGKYAGGTTYTVVDDIYTKNFPACYVASLEKYQARAYIIVPIYQKGELWGLLCTYQNDGPRSWRESEITLMQQTAQQLIVALQQAEYLAQIQAQAEQLTIAADREKKAREELQQSALRILRAIEPSFRGDLTVRAPLSEDEIGTIADGYNTTIQTLRELVRQVQSAAAGVSQASYSNNSAVAELSNQAQAQVNKLAEALQFLQQMLQSVQAITTTAQTVQQSVEEANRVVQQGDSLAELTVTSILEVRETVSETAKKIKRLGESSQKISKVVNLIENFATQTNLLALNAAIEATRAGEFGRGFAVVADEVRSLAYQSANATTEIERLVQEIQAETNGVIEAMEVGITQVVKGSGLVNETRQSLQAISQFTQKISELVLGITQATRVQEEQSHIVTQGMTDVAQIAQGTSASAAEISKAFQALLATAQALEVTVSKFKVD